MINVLLVDDSAIFRKATKQLLPEKDVISVVGECSDGKEVIGFLNSYEVNVILMDVSMKHIGGVEASELVSKTHPEVKIIGFSSHTQETYKKDMFDAGASDYIVKGTEIKFIREIIKSIV
jgi:two-component system response regulator DegU